MQKNFLQSFFWNFSHLNKNDDSRASSNDSISADVIANKREIENVLGEPFLETFWVDKAQMVNPGWAVIAKIARRQTLSKSFRKVQNFTFPPQDSRYKNILLKGSLRNAEMANLT